MPPGPSEATCGEGGAARGRGTEGGASHRSDLVRPQKQHPVLTAESPPGAF